MSKVSRKEKRAADREMRHAGARARMESAPPGSRVWRKAAKEWEATLPPASPATVVDRGREDDQWMRDNAPTYPWG